MDNTTTYTAFDSAMDAIRAAEGDDYQKEMAAVLIGCYRARWGERLEQYEVLAVEREFRFPLRNPATEAASRSFVEAGKVDAVLRRRADGRVFVMEHKTTAQSLEPGGDYFRRLGMDTQISKYLLAARQMFPECPEAREADTVLYDVVRKPALRPAAVPLLDEDGLKIVLGPDGERARTKAGGWRQSEDAAAGLVMQKRPETVAEFGERVAAAVNAAPDEFFAWKMVARLEDAMIEYMGDAWAVGQQVLHHRAAHCWPRNPDACQQFSMCEYFDLCSGQAEVDGVRFGALAERHPELDGEEEKDGLQLLTNSRMRALRRCPRLHQLAYEEGVRPLGEWSEALR